MKPKYWTYMVNRTYRCISDELPPEDAYDEGSLEALWPEGDIEALFFHGIDECANCCQEVEKVFKNAAMWNHAEGAAACRAALLDAVKGEE